MNMITRVQREIGRAKEKLERKPICEDFGRQEVRKLREKYNIATLDDINVNERNQILDAIDYFSEWCATYGG